MMGRCTLVGAGPGDPELLTLRAVRAIRRATVILVDDLVDPGALRWARRSCRIVPVGKRGGCRSTPQAFIEKLMVGEVLRGETVVRLKGGDPLIFGRAGEEIEALARHGIAVEVVNGVTAGLAAGADLGLSLTHRQFAQGVLFVTGHCQNEDRPINWAQLATTCASGVTLVVYMGMARLPDIEAGLLQGLAPATPVALVQQASGAASRAATGRLGELRELARRHGLGSPAVLIVGQAVSPVLAIGHLPTGPRPADGAAAAHAPANAAGRAVA